MPNEKYNSLNCISWPMNRFIAARNMMLAWKVWIMYNTQQEQKREALCDQW